MRTDAHLPKFLTTSEYAPRLRSRLKREQELVADAQARGWEREVERHRASQRRIQALLNDLEEGQDSNDGKWTF